MRLMPVHSQPKQKLRRVQGLTMGSGPLGIAPDRSRLGLENRSLVLQSSLLLG